MKDTRIRRPGSVPATRRSPSRVRAGGAATGLALFGLVAASCSGAGPATAADALDREAFIATYVDLRAGALVDADRQLTDSARTEVLSRHGVTEESLTAFAELHGRDVVYMTEVWNEIELRLDAMRPDAEARTDSGRESDPQRE